MRILRSVRFGAFLLGALVVAVGSRSNAGETSQPYMENGDAYKSVTWSREASVLGESGATLRPPPASRAIVNEAVNTFNRVDDPGDYENGVFRYQEAILRFDRRGTIMYSYFQTGHTIDDDFATLDPDRLMTVMKSKDCSCHPVRWEKKPAYDRQRHIVTWMVLEYWMHENEFRNTAYADIHMRSGHEYLEAYTRSLNPAAAWAELQAGIDALSIRAGTRYDDFQSGDPVGPRIAELTEIDAAPGETR